MSEYLFGLGAGWLPERADAIAQKYGAILHNYTDPQCRCGYGCYPYTCFSARRHWFACPNLGNPHDQQTSDDVLLALTEEGILP